MTKTCSRCGECKEASLFFGQRCRDCRIAACKAWRRRNPGYSGRWNAKNRDRVRTWWSANRERVNARKMALAWQDRPAFLAKKRAKRHEIKRLVLLHYSAGTLSCKCCGEAEYGFLTLDHVHGGGTKQRKQLKRTGMAFMMWLWARKCPSGYQVLCYNCNNAKGVLGVCPHTDRVDPIWAEA